jgi:hypothetical protein
VSFVLSSTRPAAQVSQSVYCPASVPRKSENCVNNTNNAYQGDGGHRHHACAERTSVAAIMAGAAGIELATSGFGDQRSAS